MSDWNEVDNQLHKLAVGISRIANDPSAVGIPLPSFINPVKDVIWNSQELEGKFSVLD